MKNNYFVHETSIIDQGAIIGDHSKIWHWTHISSGARIGHSVIIGQNVFIGNDVIIGNQCKIQNNVSVYDKITLEDGVFCGPSMVFTNVYNPRAQIEKKSEFRPTLVKKGVTFGANCTIVCGVTIGEYALIGAGAVVKKDVKAYAIMAGVPAKQIGWVSHYGEKLDLPLQGQAETVCEKSKTTYRLDHDQIIVSQSE